MSCFVEEGIVTVVETKIENPTSEDEDHHQRDGYVVHVT